MFNLIWSAFAVCLILTPVWAAETYFEDLSELEAEILPDLTGHQRFTAPDFHEKPDWRITAKDIVLDKEPLKGQGHSLIPWSTLDPEDWLSVQRWLIENEIKTKKPDWLLRLRDDRQLELVGKIMSCKGICPVYRGTMPANGSYLTRLIEGDEIRTEKNSVAWIFLIDGSLIRLGPESSLSLQEINLGKSEIFILARLNRGHVFWHARPKAEFPLELSAETEALALPLHILNANQQFFERQLFKSQTDKMALAEIMDIDEGPIKAQIKRLNEMRVENDKKLTIPTKVMLVAPNVTLVSTQLSFDLVYLTGGKAHFKKRGHEELQLQLRGYTQTDPVTVDDFEWHEVAQDGRSQNKMFEIPPALQLLELLTKRIKTIELAREIWISDFTLPIISMIDNQKLIAFEHGYTLWGEESKKRFEFLTEYTRRVETTNIKSIENLLTKIEQSGQVINRELDVGLYQHAINHYLKGLKTRYTLKKMQVREMNDLQYYVWTLKNGKL
ncbi:MAG TPA: hypothetical protein VNJ08_16095 [Bacteriovoracaceae bacterium]|nr:hypothetical protein [Bacteriovoracaceae bacterium]